MTVPYGRNFTADGEPMLVDAALLDELQAAVKKYVVLPSTHAVVAVVLWIAATHALAKFEHATRLAIHSAVKRCGKSRLLEVIESLAYNPMATTNISVPALFRVITAGGNNPPTLILDEADRLFGSAKKDEDNRDLIALINNGFRQGSPTYRCVGPQQVPTPFSNFAMAVVAGIGRKPDTIEDRAVNITMRRRLPGETVTKFRLRTDRPALHGLRKHVAAWVQEIAPALEKPVGDMPAELEDRAQDAWEPLLAIADAAGGSWPEDARMAAKELCKESADEDSSQSLEIRLLADVRATFVGWPNVTFLATKTLITDLRKIDDAPWFEIDLNPHKLARRLAKFGIRPRHSSAATERGYHLEDLLDPFSRYLPSEPSESVKTGSDLHKRLDGLEPPDTSNRQDDSDRQDETAGQTTNGHILTVSDATPADWPIPEPDAPPEDSPEDIAATELTPDEQRTVSMLAAGLGASVIEQTCSGCGKPSTFSLVGGMCRRCAFDEQRASA